jgi:hypothetical protein
MIVWGTLVTLDDVRDPVPAGTSIWWRFSALGTALALYVFMADSFYAVSQGVTVPGTVLPTVFNWPLFALAVTLMAAPVAQLAWRLMLSPGRRPVTS